MTVGELIKFLQVCPVDALVQICDSDANPVRDGYDVTSVIETIYMSPKNKESHTVVTLMAGN